MQRSIALSVCLVARLVSTAAGDLVYLQFSGGDGSGNIDGTPYSGATWMLEFEIDNTVADSLRDTQQRLRVFVPPWFS